MRKLFIAAIGIVIAGKILAGAVEPRVSEHEEKCTNEAQDSDSAKMRYFKNPNRCEGTTSSAEIGFDTHDLAILSLHRNFAHFEEKAFLNVRFFLPQISAGELKNFAVKAQELTPQLKYYMRSKLPEGGWHPGINCFKGWSTNNVIDKLHISADNLVIYASYLDKDQNYIYVPVDVGLSSDHYDSCAAPSKSEAATPYIFTFYSGVNLNALHISVLEAASEKEVKVQDIHGSRPHSAFMSAGNTHTFTIDMSDLPEGLYKVQLTGEVHNNSEQPKLSMVMYHHP